MFAKVGESQIPIQILSLRPLFMSWLTQRG